MRKKSMLVTGVGSILIVIALLLVQKYLEIVPIDELAKHEGALRKNINGSPFTALLIGLIAYYLISLIPGTPGKSIVCGWFFGMLIGTVIVMVGLVAAAVTVFSVSRYFFRDQIESHLTGRLERWEHLIEREGGFCIVTLRLLHAPYWILNVIASVTPVRVLTFAWATFLGLLPTTLLFVYVGSELPSLQELAERGVGEVVGPKLIVGMMALALVPIGIRAFVRWYWPEWAGEEDEADYEESVASGHQT